ncbi:hypothetical protein F0L17_14565 [Streptomyces sp. TRM43335]|uniref:Uncharacterized protein n=1 Tax=Streptomyces taklimakanensis TaxID=2569853 RepID=A0A6G2BDH6_9ACTN|nr:hypothetical protein [Streptomyces taklimakanensis]MTE20308.1 hypothetical protein [Streptomyces taklimakanensis]
MNPPQPSSDLIADIETADTGHLLDPTLTAIAQAPYQPGLLRTLAHIRELDQTPTD